MQTDRKLFECSYVVLGFTIPWLFKYMYMWGTTYSNILKLAGSEVEWELSAGVWSQG